jgi:hypothetical protein
VNRAAVVADEHISGVLPALASSHTVIALSGLAAAVPTQHPDGVPIEGHRGVSDGLCKKILLS